MDDSFNENELIELAYETGIDYEAIIGNNKAVKAREMVAHFGRRELIDLLLAELAELRPNVNWYAALLETGELVV